MTADDATRRQPPALDRDPLLWLAAGGGSGLAPWAPGTFGSLVGLAAAIAFQFAPVAVAWGAWIAAALAGPAICARGVRAAGYGDPGWVVWDEVVGVWLAVLLAPRDWSPAALGWGAAFVLFRVFDIAKPGLIRRCERLPGGWGVMADDVAAGAAAGAAAWLLRWAISPAL